MPYDVVLQSPKFNVHGATTYELYRNLCAHLIQNTAGNLRLLEILDQADADRNREIRFQLAGGAQDAIEFQILTEKKTVLKAFVATVQPRPQLTAAQIDEPGRDSAWCNERLGEFIAAYRSPSVVQIRAIRTMNAANVAAIRAAMLAWLNGAASVEHRLLMADVLVAEMAYRVWRNPRQPDNRTRVSILTYMLEHNGAEPPEPADTTNTSVEHIEAVQQLKAALKKKVTSATIPNAVLQGSRFTFSDADSVLFPACDKVLGTIESQSGIADLEKARSLAYDPDGLLAALVADLSEMLLAALETYQCSILWIGSGNLANRDRLPVDLRVYIAPVLTQYAQALNSANWPFTSDAANYTADTNRRSSIDPPLLVVGATNLRFFNLRSSLYLIEDESNARRNRSLRFLDADIAQVALTDLTADTAREVWNGLAYDARRDYLPAYIFDPDNRRIRSELFWRLSSGIGNGIGRADPVRGPDYLWRYMGDINALRDSIIARFGQFDNSGELSARYVGAFLGLDPGRMVQDDRVLQSSASVGGHSVHLADSGYRHAALEYRDQGSAAGSKCYTLCNTPDAGLGATSNTRIPDDIRARLAQLHINYYRQAEAKPPFRVMKSAGLRSRPQPGDYGHKGDDDFYIAPPISFRIELNVQKFRSEKANRAVVKNKGAFLRRNRSLRQDAGQVMSALRSFSTEFIGSGSLSAAEVTRAILRRRTSADSKPQDSRAGADWRLLKLAEIADGPTTDQEWCHLHGHGDGGDERVGNFVAGSFHCNTEQLAIESAQRPTTQQAERFVLKSTAYLLSDDSMRTDASGRSYISADPLYLGRAYPDSRPILVRGQTPPTPDEEIKGLQRNAPVAAFIRYKVIDSQARQKVFDYVFEGQSEFFDRNQYNILGAIVRLLLAPENFYRDLRDSFLQAKAAEMAVDGAGQ